jgi:hypothetical protein
MSEQKKKFDIKSYIAYFKKFHDWEYHYLLLVRFYIIL